VKPELMADAPNQVWSSDITKLAGPHKWNWFQCCLLREDKRSSPGTDDGFRAIALLPLVDGLELDVVSGRARQGQHSVEHIASYEVRSGELVEVSQRVVNSNHGGRQIN
jgi:hypothetical protein